MSESMALMPAGQIDGSEDEGAPEMPSRPDGLLDGEEVMRWARRIQASRAARDARKDNWATFATLHARAYVASLEGNDDATAILPDGDQVSLGLVHSNIEQTLGALELPDVTVAVERIENRREMDRGDEHQEAIVSQALRNSLHASGMLGCPEIVDLVKRDALICGHGVVYSQWEQRWATEQVMIAEPIEGTNVTRLAQIEVERVVREEVEDTYVSPLEFLFDPQAPTIALSRWHGMERLVSLADLKRGGLYAIPDWVQGDKRSRSSIYGDEPADDECAESDLVALVTCYEKSSRTLLQFLEVSGPESAAFNDPQDLARDRSELLPVLVETFPVGFAGAHDSPFSAYVPIPAQDNPYGISQVMHLRRSAVEADKMETRLTNLARQMKVVWAYDKTQGLDDDQIKTALAQRDYSVVGLDNPFGKKLEEMFSALPLPRLHPELFSGISQARTNVNLVSGISDVPYGGAETATESENMMQIGGARKNRKLRLLLRFLSDVARVHCAYMAAWSPSGQAVEVLGGDGQPFVQLYGREAFAGLWRIEISPGGQSGSVSPVQRKADLELVGLVFPNLTPPAQLVMLRQALVRAGWTSINALLRAQQMGMGMLPYGQPPPQGGGVDGRLLADSYNPNDQNNGQALRAGANQLFESTR